MNMNSTENTKPRIVLRNMFLKDVYGTYSDMYTRPYVVKNLNGNTARKFREAVKVNLSNNAMVSVDVFSNTDLGNFVGISNTPSDAIRLPNGNSTRRLQVFMVVETTEPSQSGGYYIYIIQGYTSYHGVMLDPSVPGKIMIDDNMDIIVNSIMEFNKRLTGDQRLSPVITLVNSYNTIGEFINFQKAEHDKFVMSRTKDVHTVLSRRSIVENYDQGIYVDDAGSISSPSPITSNRSNSDTSMFMSNIVNSFQTGRVYSSTPGLVNSHMFGDEATYSHASDVAREPIATNNLLVRLLSEEEQSIASNCFKVGSVRRMFYGSFDSAIAYLPFTDRVLKERISLNTDLGIDNDRFRNPGTTINADVVTNAVLEFNNSITSVITSVGLSQVRVLIDYITNMQPVIQIVHARSLAGDGYVPTAVNKAEVMIKTLSVARFANNIQGIDRFSAIIDINILTETVMQISVPYMNYVDLFRFPTYCDSSYMPVLMKKNERNQFVNDIQTFCDEISYTKI